MRWKKFLLLTCKTLALLGNALPADENCPLLNRDNLTIIIEMQSSQKQNTFYEFFAAFLKCSLNFKYFEKKNDRHTFRIFEITDSENVAR